MTTANKGGYHLRGTQNALVSAHAAVGERKGLALEPGTLYLADNQWFVIGSRSSLSSCSLV